MSLPRFIRTLAPLRREQLIWRPVRMVQRRLYRHLPLLTRRWTDESAVTPAIPPERLEQFRAALTNELLHLQPESESVRRQLEEIAAGRFTFLNQTIDLSRTDGIPGQDGPDWNHRHGNHLWNFHLHYFPFITGAAWYLSCEGSEGSEGHKGQGGRENREGWLELFRPVQRLIEDWILNARPGQSDGWEAYPVSVRVVNWIYGYALLARDYPDQRFIDRWRGSIERQLDFLAGHLELHLLANHLFRNIRALIIGGIFFDRDRWIEQGLRLFRREIDEQILPDGGHFERSPMYHAQTLGDIIECTALLRRFGHPLPATIDEKISKMADFLAALSYSDGRLSLFNDSANTPETKPGPIITAARRLTKSAERSPSVEFALSGYYLWQSDTGAEKLIIDAGPPSVSYNTAHAHCDLLSFELQIAGRPWILDTGVHGYGGDRFRHYCRSTRAHNTVSINGREQSEIWSTFRMGGTGRILESDASHSEQGWYFRGRAVHYGQPRLQHERCFQRDAAGTWTITDRITGGQFHFAESFLHFHRDLEVRKDDDGSYLLRMGLPGVGLLAPGSAVRRLTVFGGMSVELIEAGEDGADGWYFPEFGVAVPGQMLVGRFAGLPSGADGAFGFHLAPVTGEEIVSTAAGPG
ncbi:MAG: hypothetical protein EBZ36_04950 [Acidobacteria bacterium]|nr:hypothetical protein [Acidobacteriota bacterium]